MRLSAGDFLRLLWRQLSPRGSDDDERSFSSALEALRNHSFDAPGWRPAARKVCLGWIDYGADWYGHNANTPGESVIARFSPSRRVAISIAARQDHAAYHFLANVFARKYPDLIPSPLSRLKRLTEAQWRSVDPHRYYGTFENSSIVIVVDGVGCGALRARVFRKLSAPAEPEAPVVECKLIAADQNVFFCEPSDSPILPYIQFLNAERTTGFFCVVQNGRQIFRRTH